MQLYTYEYVYVNMLRPDTPTLSLSPQTLCPPRFNHALLKNEIESEGGEDVVGTRERGSGKG
jgi:hypothetical protein